MGIAVVQNTEISTRLLEASFRGVRFYVDRVSVAGGRKANEKAIVNSDEQIVDDVGMKQRSYSVQGFIAARYSKKLVGNEFGISSEYDTERKTFLEALEKRQPALLVHPIEGDIEGVVAKTWSIDESLSEVGIGRLSIEFVRETVRPVPFEAVGQKGNVKGKTEAFKFSLVKFLTDTYGVDLSFIKSFQDNLAKVDEFYGEIQDAAKSVENLAGEIGEFTQFISNGTAAASSLILAPIALADAIQGAFASLNSIFPTLAASFKGMTNAFEYGDFDLEFDITSPSGKQKKRNFDVLNATVQGTALAFAYDAAVEFDFLTVAEIEVVEEILEAQHQKMIDAGTLSIETLETMIEMRESFFDFLAVAKVSARKVTSETVADFTPRTLAYALYEDDDLAPTLASLNGVETYEVVTGEVEVLSQ